MRISFKSTFSAVAGLMTLMTASTAMGPSRLVYCETILLERDVLAACRSEFRSLSVTGVDIVVKISTDFAAAR